MDLKFALQELKMKFEQSYTTKHEMVSGQLNERGFASSGDRWKQERKTYRVTMEATLETMFDSIERHIAYLTNRSAKRAISSFEQPLDKYFSDRYNEFHEATMKSRAEIDRINIGDALYEQLESEMRHEIEIPVGELIKNRINKIDQIIRGRPNPIWNRTWIASVFTAILTLLVGAILLQFQTGNELISSKKFDRLTLGELEVNKLLLKKSSLDDGYLAIQDADGATRLQMGLVATEEWNNDVNSWIDQPIILMMNKKNNIIMALPKTLDEYKGHTAKP